MPSHMQRPDNVNSLLTVGLYCDPEQLLIANNSTPESTIWIQLFGLIMAILPS